MSHDPGARCACTTEHRPTPLELHSHHVWPLAMGGPDTQANRVWVCPTTHVNIHEMLARMMKVGPMNFQQSIDYWPQAVSRYAHGVALRGYAQWRDTHPLLTTGATP